MKLCHRFLAAFAFVAFVVSFPSTGRAVEQFVEIQGIEFIPPNITILVGDKVTWTNNSTLQHTVTSGIGCVASGMYGSALLNPGETFSFTFNSPGTVPYFCIPHCLVGMTGSVIVDQAVATENSTWGAIKKLYDIEDAQ